VLHAPLTTQPKLTRVLFLTRVSNPQNMFTILMTILFGPFGFLAGLLNGRAKKRHRETVAILLEANPVAKQTYIKAKQQKADHKAIFACLLIVIGFAGALVYIASQIH
jgi:predicted permease